jgi:CheY-like chemotaxis protein
VTRHEGTPALVSGDADRLHAAVLNLALNARDAMPAGGTLTLSARRVELEKERSMTLGLPPGPYLELAVADTGVGLTEEARSHLFEPFFTTKAAGKGSGLGLAEVYGTVQAHAGAVTVASAVGQGTTVTVLLPRAAPPGVTTGARGAPSVAPGRRLRVLVVDDEPSVRRSLSLLLRTSNCQVLECDGTRAGLQALVASPPALDLAIVDMMMPELTGREVVAALRAAHPGLAVIVSTGLNTGDELETLIAEPAVYVLQKPYTHEQLRRSLAIASLQDR